MKTGKGLVVFFLVFLPFSFNGHAQTLQLREISRIFYQTDFTSIADRNKEDLFPKGNTVGFVHFYRGISLLRQRAYQESVYDFQSALADSAVSRSLCNLYLGIAYMQMNKPDSILSMYSRTMNIPADDLKNAEFWNTTPYLRENTFAAYLMATNNAIYMNQDTLLIEAMFGYATKNPDFYDAFFNYGTYSFLTGHYSRAINHFLKARELDKKDDSEILLCLGYLYRLVGDNDQSIKSYNVLLSHDPVNAPAYNNLGCVYAYVGKYPTALKNISKATKINTRLVEAWYNRGIVYLRMEKFTEARDDFNTVILLTPEFGDAFYYRGFTKKALGDLTGSVADFTRALELKKYQEVNN